MYTSRRKFLMLAGGGVVLAAAAASGQFLASRRPDAALKPWDLAGQYNDPRLNALSFAILAPNPHNRQPWVAELMGEDQIRIHRDLALNLPATDPLDRQLTIGMGCFLELLRMAAAQGGFASDVTLFPDGEDGPVAEVTFLQGGEADPLFAYVLERRTNRLAYDERPLPGEAAAALSAYAEIVTVPAAVAEIRNLARDAMRTEMTTGPAMMESVELMRIGKSEIEATPDGIALGGPLLESLALVGFLSREAMADPDSRGFAQGLEMTLAAMDSTPAYASITTGGNRRADQIEAGYRWLRLHLAATGLGIAVQPVSQALQEYPEMAALYARAHELLAGPGETVQMLGRLGYGPVIDASPRWPLETKILYA